MKNSGFTLIELLIVIVIVAILAGALVPMLNANRVMAQQARARADLDTIRTGALMLFQDTNSWPAGSAVGRQDGVGVFSDDDGSGDADPTIAGWTGPYVNEWAAADGAAGDPGLDPWGHRFRIRTGGAGPTAFREVVTLGDNDAIDVPPAGQGTADQDFAVRICTGC